MSYSCIMSLKRKNSHFRLAFFCIIVCIVFSLIAYRVAPIAVLKNYYYGEFLPVEGILKEINNIKLGYRTSRTTLQQIELQFLVSYKVNGIEYESDLFAPSDKLVRSEQDADKLYKISKFLLVGQRIQMYVRSDNPKVAYGYRDKNATIALYIFIWLVPVFLLFFAFAFFVYERCFFTQIKSTKDV
jgi:hypothetical protein